ncbi:MAG: hypothetical protein R6W89_08625, partial [Candidatus Hydrogenedentota bacterium]
MFRAVAMGISAILLLGVAIAIGPHSTLLAAAESPSEQREEPPQEQGHRPAEEGSPSPDMEALMPQEGEASAEDLSLENLIPDAPDEDAPEGPDEGADDPPIQELVPDASTGEEPGAPDEQRGP